MTNKPKQFRRPKNKRSKRFVPKERTDRQAMYNTPEWKTYRFRYLHHNPTCYTCGAPSKVLEHVIPHKGNTDLFWNITNIIPLCTKCHNYVTAKFDKLNRPVEEKMRWYDKKRKELNIDIKVKIVERK